MSIIHMETEQTIQVAQRLSQMCEQLGQRAQSLRANIDGVEWSGDSHEMFVTEFRQFSSGFEQQLQAGVELSERVKREVAEWINGDSAFGDAAVSNPIPGLPPSDQFDPDSEFGQVLGAIDVNNELNQKPGVIAWAKEIFDVIKGIFGKDAATDTLAKALKGLGFLKSSAGLITSSNEIYNASNQWETMSELYGPNDPRTLDARLEYSSAELDQFLGLTGLPIDFLAKLSGKWETLVRMFDQAKYEGPSLLDGMNIFNPPNAE